MHWIRNTQKTICILNPFGSHAINYVRIVERRPVQTIHKMALVMYRLAEHCLADLLQESNDAYLSLAFRPWSLCMCARAISLRCSKSKTYIIKISFSISPKDFCYHNAH